MKVKELVEKLLEMPQDSPVEMVIPGDIYIATSRKITVNQREDGCVELSPPIDEEDRNG